MNFKMEMIDVDLIDVDERVQNKLNMNRVKKYHKNFNINAFAVLNVSKRGSRYHCTDGAHRLALAKMLGWQKVPCLILENLTLKEEGQAYIDPNINRKKPSALENFRIMLNIDDKDALMINDIIKSCGTTINFNDSSSSNGIRAIGACVEVYNTYGANELKQSLEIIINTWGSENAYASAIKGMAKFLNAYYHEENFSMADFKKKLKRVDIDSIRREVTSESRNFGIGVNLSFARIMVRHYNKGKSSRKLTDKL